MTGRTNYTPPSTSQEPNGPAQDTDIYEHFDPLIGETRDTIAELPEAADNWPGRTIYVKQDRSLRVWDDTLNQWVPIVQTGSYTPGVSGISQGDGTIEGTFTKMGRRVHVEGSFTLGSTSAVAASVFVTLPFPAAAKYGTASTNFPLGTATLLDRLTQIYTGVVMAEASTSQVVVYAQGVGGAYATRAMLAAAVPFVWGNGDSMSWSFDYLAAD